MKIIAYWKASWSIRTVRPYVGGDVNMFWASCCLFWVLRTINKNTEAVYSYGENAPLNEVIDLVFREGYILPTEMEVALLALMRVIVKPEKIYLCCNRRWQEGKNWKAHLWLEGLEYSSFQGLNIARKLLRVR